MSEISLKIRLQEMRYWLVQRRLQKLGRAVIWKLPKKVVYWATIRLWAHATTGPWGDTNPTSLTLDEALKRWEKGGMTGYRDDSVRLKELLIETTALNTHDVTKLCPAAARVFSYAKSIAGEIGMDLRNPPVPGVCKKAGGDCGCGGNC